MKINRALTALTFAASVGFAAQSASADILADYTPSGPLDLYEANWTNETLGQNFLVRFSTAGSASITGFNLYLNQGFGSLGDTVTLRLATDSAGAPDGGSIQEFVSTIDSLTPFGDIVHIAHASFAPIAIGAGAHWAGLSGTSGTLTWSSYFGDGNNAPSDQYQLSNATPSHSPGIYHLAYSIEGTQGGGGVPEPAVWGLMIVGFGGMGMTLRRRRAAIA